jgi:hypothetical protein
VSSSASAKGSVILKLVSVHVAGVRVGRAMAHFGMRGKLRTMAKDEQLTTLSVATASSLSTSLIMESCISTIGAMPKNPKDVLLGALTVGLEIFD